MVESTIVVAMEPVTRSVLDAGLAEVLLAPRERGRVELLVARPAPGMRRILETATLDPGAGLVGDSWLARGSRHTPDGSAHPQMQLTIMSARVAALVAGPPDRWALSGDQLFVDLALDADNLVPGTRLALGGAVVEITDQPHTGCAKYRDRFGSDAVRFVNSPTGRRHNLRGVNARVLTTGVVQVGDTIVKLPVED